MDKKMREAGSSKEGTKKSEQPWSSREFRKTGELNPSDWQSLENKLRALQDPNTSTTEKTKKLQEYNRDLENYQQYACEPSYGDISAIAKRLPNNIDDKAGINNSLDAIIEHKNYSK